MEPHDLEPQELNALMGLSLALAAKVGQLSLVKQLLDAGVDPNAVDDERRPALLLACGAPTTQPFTVEVVKALLGAGANPNLAPMGTRPLNSVLSRDNPNIEIVKALVAAGADARYDGGRMLVLAVEIHDVAIVRELVRAGADVNKAVPIGGPDKLETPFEVATRRQRADVAQLLVDAGAVIPAFMRADSYWFEQPNNPVRRIVNADIMRRNIEQVMAHDAAAAAPSPSASPFHL